MVQEKLYLPVAPRKIQFILSLSFPPTIKSPLHLAFSFPSLQISLIHLARLPQQYKPVPISNFGLKEPPYSLLCLVALLVVRSVALIQVRVYYRCPIVHIDPRTKQDTPVASGSGSTHATSPPTAPPPNVTEPAPNSPQELTHLHLPHRWTWPIALHVRSSSHCNAQRGNIWQGGQGLKYLKNGLDVLKALKQSRGGASRGQISFRGLWGVGKT